MKLVAAVSALLISTSVVHSQDMFTLSALMHESQKICATMFDTNDIIIEARDAGYSKELVMEATRYVLGTELFWVEVMEANVENAFNDPSLTFPTPQERAEREVWCEENVLLILLNNY